MSEAAEFAMPRLRGLGDLAMRLRADTADSDTVAGLAETLKNVLHSVYWEQRAVADAGGLASAGLTDEERAARQRIVAEALALAQKTAISRIEASFVLRISTSEQYAANRGVFDFETNAARWREVRRLWGRDGLSRWAGSALTGCLENTAIAAASVGEDVEAAALIGDVMAQLEDLPLEFDAIPAERRGALINVFNCAFYRIATRRHAFLPLEDLWHRANRQPWISGGWTDGCQPKRIDLAVQALQAYQAMGLPDRAPIWQAVGNWAGGVPWTKKAWQAYETGPLIYAALCEADQGEIVEAALRAMAKVLPRPQGAAGEGVFSTHALSALIEWFPSDQQIGAVGAQILAKLILEDGSTAAPGARATTTEALVKLIVQLATSRQTPAALAILDDIWRASSDDGRSWLVSAVLRAATALIGFPAIGRAEAARFAVYARDAADVPNAAFRDESLIALAAALCGEPDLGLSPGDFIDRPRRSHMDARAAADLDKRLADILAARIKRSVDAEAARADLAHLRALAMRTPSAGVVQGYEAFMTLLPTDDPELTRLTADRHHVLRIMEHADSIGRRHESIRHDLSDLSLRRYGAPGDAFADVEPKLRQQSWSEAIWPFEPLYAGDWREVREAQEAASIVSRIASAFAGGAFFQTLLARSMLAMRTTQPRFYEAATVVEILLSGDPKAGGASQSVMFLLGQNAAIPIEGTSPRIHAFNAESPPRLASPDDALAYARFFCGAVHGEEGPFTLTASLEALSRRLRPGAAALDPALAELFKPDRIEPPASPNGAGSSESNWRLSTIIHYSHAVFAAKFAIQPSGMMEMEDDEPIAQDLPIWQPRFRNGLRGWPEAD